MKPLTYRVVELTADAEPIRNVGVKARDCTLAFNAEYGVAPLSGIHFQRRARWAQLITREIKEDDTLVARLDCGDVIIAHRARRIIGAQIRGCPGGYEVAWRRVGVTTEWDTSGPYVDRAAAERIIARRGWQLIG